MYSQVHPQSILSEASHNLSRLLKKLNFKKVGRDARTNLLRNFFDNLKFLYFI